MVSSEENKSTQKPEEENRNINSTKLFIGLLLSPTLGWRNLRNSKVLPSTFEQQTFYPILAITAVCSFLTLIYEPTTPIARILQNAIAAFVSIFAAYFAAIGCAKTVLPPEASKKASTCFFRVFIAASMATLDTGYMLSIIAPQLRILFWLGLIYTLYIVCKGVKYLHVPENERLATSVICCLLVCALPAVIFAVFTMIMPGVE